MKTKIFTLVVVILLSTQLYSQNITNTLGTGGLFTIKDVSNNFLTLNQSTGEVNLLKTLRLENTTNSGIGIIFKGTERFLHNYGPNNTFLGINSGNFSMSGYSNTAVGYTSLYSNTTGAQNTAVGRGSLYSNTAGYSNTAVGQNSLFSNTSFSNTAVGFSSLYFNTNGHSNTAVGWSSLYANTTGQNNTALGYHSLFSNTTGDFNIAVGHYAGSNITTGNNLICIGYDAQPSTGSANSQITLGNNQITSLRSNVQTITSLSDARDKKNITDLSLGLDFLMKVKPRFFNWDKREWYENNISDGSKMKETPTAGFIAQELDEVQTAENAEWLNLVLKDNPEKLEATYGNLLPVMVKAIQELKAENDKLKTDNKNLRPDLNSMKELNEKLSKFEQTQSEFTKQLELLKKDKRNIKTNFVKNKINN